MQPRHRQQHDLFAEGRKTPQVPPALRSVIVRLIEGLLNEALVGGRSETSVATPETKEVAHEQDHA